MSGTSKKLCKVDGCDKRVDSRGYCLAHYNRIRRSGTPDLKIRRNEDLDEMFNRLAQQGAPVQGKVGAYEEEVQNDQTEELKRLLKAAYDLVCAGYTPKVPRRKSVSANAKSRSRHKA